MEKKCSQHGTNLQDECYVQILVLCMVLSWQVI